MEASREKILLHTCCATCTGGAAERLRFMGFKEIVFFEFNPNIFPEDEHRKRASDIKMLAWKMGIQFIEGAYDHDEWLRRISPFEKEPEGGKRCAVCFAMRLEESARKAKENNIIYFTSTLSISPHKDFEQIARTGDEVAARYGRIFLKENFKKKDGFLRSLQISRENNFYRQSYCGCEFSMRIRTQ